MTAFPPSPERVGRAEDDEQQSASALETLADGARADLPESEREQPQDDRQQRVHNGREAGHGRRRLRRPASRPPHEDEREPMIGDERVEQRRRGGRQRQERRNGTRHYRATSCARISRMTVTLILPGKSISVSILRARSEAKRSILASSTSSVFAMTRISRPA